MNHNAIRKAYPTVVTIDDSKGCFDQDGNLVEIDDKKVSDAVKVLEKEFQAAAEAKAAQRQAILDRLGLSQEEANILLGGN